MQGFQQQEVGKTSKEGEETGIWSDFLKWPNVTPIDCTVKSSYKFLAIPVISSKRNYTNLEETSFRKLGTYSSHHCSAALCRKTGELLLRGVSGRLEHTVMERPLPGAAESERRNAVWSSRLQLAVQSLRWARRRVRGPSYIIPFMCPGQRQFSHRLPG